MVGEGEGSWRKEVRKNEGGKKRGGGWVGGWGCRTGRRGEKRGTEKGGSGGGQKVEVGGLRTRG